MAPKKGRRKDEDWEDEMGEVVGKGDEPKPEEEEEAAPGKGGKGGAKGKKGKGKAFDEPDDEDAPPPVKPATEEEGDDAAFIKGAKGRKGKKGKATAFDEEDDEDAPPAKAEEDAAPAKGAVAKGGRGKKGKGKGKFDEDDEDDDAPPPPSKAAAAAEEEDFNASAPAKGGKGKKGKKGKGKAFDEEEDDDLPPPPSKASAAAAEEEDFAASAPAKGAKGKKGKKGKGKAFDEDDEEDDLPPPPSKAAAAAEEEEDEEEEEEDIPMPVKKGKGKKGGGGFGAALAVDELRADDVSEEEEEEEAGKPEPAQSELPSAPATTAGTEAAPAFGPVAVRVLSAARHPDADKLTVCQVDVGNVAAPVQVVCGAHNVRPGLLAVFVPAGGSVSLSGEAIEARAVRGVESLGMLCGGGELGLERELPSHVVELNADSANCLGKPFEADWVMPWPPPLNLSAPKPPFADLWARVFDAAEQVEAFGLTLFAPEPSAEPRTFKFGPKREEGEGGEEGAGAGAEGGKKKKKLLLSKFGSDAEASEDVAKAEPDEPLGFGGKKKKGLAALADEEEAKPTVEAADEPLGFGGKKKKKALSLKDDLPLAPEPEPAAADAVAEKEESVGFGRKKKGKEGKDGAGGKGKGKEAVVEISAEQAALDAELEAELAAELGAPVVTAKPAQEGEEAGEGNEGEEERPGWMDFVKGKDGKRDKKGGKKGGRKGGGGPGGVGGGFDDAMEDDEDAMLNAAITKAAAAKGVDPNAEAKGKKGKKKKGGKKEEAGDTDEDALLDAALAEKAAAKAETDAAASADKDAAAAAAAGEGGEGEDEDGDGEEGGEGKELTKAQKKKLKAKQKKKEEEKAGKEKGGKPQSAMVKAMKEAQEKRRLIECVEEDIANMREDAKAFVKKLDTLNLGDKALTKVDAHATAAEVSELHEKCEALIEEVREKTESGELYGITFEHLPLVAEVVRGLQAGMADWLKADERRKRAKEKEKIKKEGLKAAGLLMTKAERDRRTKDEAFRQQLASQGMATGVKVAEGEGEARTKKVVYGKKKPPKKGGDEGDAASIKSPAKPGAPEGQEGQEDEEGEGEEEGNVADAPAAGDDEEDDWEAVDVEAVQIDKSKSSSKEEDEEDEEERIAKARRDELSNKLEQMAKDEVAKAKAAKLEKLYNFKAPPPKDAEGEFGSDEEDDDEDEGESGSDSDSDSESDSEEDPDEKRNAEREAERLARLENAKKARIMRMEKSMKERSPTDLRSPIVCIMGHVDTGKTKLLDKIRRTNVQAGEAGGITQQIGASFFPAEKLREVTKDLCKVSPVDVNVPGLLIIDTPGHESFSNLRSRGSSLCDIAILVIDIMHGLEPQTIESLHMLRAKKTPFIVALNKVDRLYDWKEQPWTPFREALASQAEHVQGEFEDRAAKAKLALAEQGLNAELYWKNTDYRENISIVPTSAITGEGIPDMLQLIVMLTQKFMVQRMMWCAEPQATVLEVKVVEGLGHTVDIILANGQLRQGDTIVLCGFNGPIVTTVRALLTPQPLKELRLKADYIHHECIRGAQGVKISANNLEKVVAGGALMVLNNPKDEDELEVLKQEVMVDLAKLAKTVSDLSDGDGVYAMASTLGSLEALLEFLKKSNIPVHAINIGPVHKMDVIRASTQLERHNPEYATILAFDVPVVRDAEKHAEDLGVKIFTAQIIYHLFDKFTQYMVEVKAKKQEAARLIAAFPCIVNIIPEFIFNRGGPGDPFVAGMVVKDGVLRRGSPLCVINLPAAGREEDGPTIVELGRVASIEKDKKPVDELKKGQSGAVKVDTPSNVTFGRHFTATSVVYSRMTRESIDALKEHFKDELSKDEWQLVIKLKRMFAII